MKIHIVQKGDTLWELSKQYGVDFEALKQANPQLASPDMIMPGMKIKIPSNSKAVKKETMPAKEMPKKETQMKETQHPYQHHTPKPMPVIQEDDHEKKMIAKPQMPVQPLHQMSPQPIMEQEFQNYTTINFPQMPQHHEAKKEKPKEHVKAEMHHMPMPTKPKEHVKAETQHMPMQHHMPMPMPMPQLQFQPMPCPEPVHMMPCCHMVHPCYPQMPFPVMVNPEWIHQSQHMQHGMPCEPMPAHPFSPTMEMPMNHMNPMHMNGNNDCGCRESIPMAPFDMQSYGNEQQDMNQQMSHPLQSTPSGNIYPPQFAENVSNHNLYPNPPAYPDFSNMQNQGSDQTTDE